MGGLVRYLFGPGRAEEHINPRIVAASDPTWLGTVQPDGVTLAQLISELDEPVIVHGDKTRAGYVYHLVVSVPAGDGQLSDDRWQQTAQRFAEKLGFDEQVHWIAINHGTSTNGNDHIHFVANLIHADDGRVHKLAFDRMRQREACIELEEEFGLTATSPAGMGEGRSLSRREVEQLRSGEVGNVSDLGQHRVATIVRAVATGARSEGEYVERLRGEGLVLRPRQEKDRPGVITGYSVAERAADGRLVWYGGVGSARTCGYRRCAPSGARPRTSVSPRPRRGSPTLSVAGAQHRRTWPARRMPCGRPPADCRRFHLRTASPGTSPPASPQAWWPRLPVRQLTTGPAAS